MSSWGLVFLCDLGIVAYNSTIGHGHITGPVVAVRSKINDMLGATEIPSEIMSYLARMSVAAESMSTGMLF